MNTIRTDCFLHGDVENLKYFRDKNGISFMLDISIKPVAYAMAGADIVKVFYNVKEADHFMDCANKISLPNAIYFFDEKLMKK